MPYQRFLNIDRADPPERWMKALTFFWTQFVVILSHPLISQVGSWERPEIHTSNMLSFVGRSSWQICIPSLAVKEMIPTTGVTSFHVQRVVLYRSTRHQGQMMEDSGEFNWEIRLGIRLRLDCKRL